MLSKIVLSLGIALALTASNESPAQAQATRSFSMGFTDYSHDLITEPGAWDQTAQTVGQLGDLLVIHEEESVPWTEALANRPDLLSSGVSQIHSAARGSTLWDDAQPQSFSSIWVWARRSSLRMPSNKAMEPAQKTRGSSPIR